MSHPHAWGEDYEGWTGILPPKNVGASFIRLTCRALGVFPKTAKDGTLDFPAHGEIEDFSVTGWEYLAAKETGKLQEVTIRESFTFNRHQDFKNYVDHFYQLKKKLDPKTAEYLYAKLFLNSLYGKFAANPERYRNYWVIPSKEGVELANGKILGGFVGCQFDSFIGSRKQFALISAPLEEDQQRYYNVATAGSITGFVRASMWRAVCKARRPYYCDTDGLWCEGLNLPISKELGEWKLEFEGSRLAIAGKKLYAASDGSPWTGWNQDGSAPKGWKVASKGVKLSGPDIFKVANGEVLTHRKEGPSMSLKMGNRWVERKVRKTV